MAWCLPGLESRELWQHYGDQITLGQGLDTRHCPLQQCWWWWTRARNANPYRGKNLPMFKCRFVVAFWNRNNTMEKSIDAHIYVLVGLLVGWLVIHSLLKGTNVTLPCTDHLLLLGHSRWKCDTAYPSHLSEQVCSGRDLLPLWRTAVWAQVCLMVDWHV